MENKKDHDWFQYYLNNPYQTLSSDKFILCVEAGQIKSIPRRGKPTIAQRLKIIIYIVRNVLRKGFEVNYTFDNKCPVHIRLSDSYWLETAKAKYAALHPDKEV